MLPFRVVLLGIGLLCAVHGAAGEQFKTIETKNGEIRGARSTTLLKKTPYYSFKGIPYAKAPVGDLRFKAPEPIDQWKPAVLDALEHGKICMQPSKIFPLSFAQSEDCLTLNIYVPETSSDEKLAVLFFVHGGGYMEGSSDDIFYGGDFIVEKETILVTVNYRLGAFGFLSLDTPEYSGNMGLKDQQLALKWVSDNIDRFGGDNKRITIFGQSAGGASTHFHILSAESRKYFRNAIPMSGTVENYWAMSDENDHLKLAYQIAEELGEPKQTVEELVEVLKRAPAEKLSEYSEFGTTNLLLEFTFTPVIESKNAIRPFMTASHKKLYSSSKINKSTMFTLTSAEILGFVKTFFPSPKELEANFSVSLPIRNTDLSLDPQVHQEFLREIREHYFEDAEINDDQLQSYVKLLSDLMLTYGVSKISKIHADKSNGKTYMSWFSVDSKLNVFKRQDPDLSKISGASHCDDLCYLFRCGLAQPFYEEIINNLDDEHSKISLQTIEYYTKIFTNFAKYDEPSPAVDPVAGLEPAQKGKIHYFEVTNDGIVTGPPPNQKADQFWTSIENRAIKLSKLKKQQMRDEF